MDDSATHLTPDLQSSLICDDVRQERNGKFILIGLFDMIGVPQVPFRYPRICTVTRWCSGLGTFTQENRIMRPDQSTPVISSQPIEISLPNPESVAINVQVQFNIEFPEVGVYWVETLLDGELRLRYPLPVHQVVGQRPPTTHP